MSELIALTDAEVDMVSGGADPTRTVNILAILQRATAVATAQGGNGGIAISFGTGAATANGGAATAEAAAANLAF